MGSQSTDGRRTTQNPQSTQRSIVSAVSAASALVVVTASLGAQQPDRARTEALARRATERLQALQREADRLASEERSLLNDVKKLELDRQIRAEEMKRLDADATTLRA